MKYLITLLFEANAHQCAPVKRQKGKSFCCRINCPILTSPHLPRRASYGMLYVFEATEESKKERRLKPDFKKAITSYQRSAAGTSWTPENLRTPETLLHTVRYLMTEILSNEGKEKVTLQMLYEFIHDRLRAVRQELVIQRADDEVRRQVLECAIVFYSVSCLKMAFFKKPDFDAADNSSQIHMCLGQLIDIYDRDTPDSLGVNGDKLNRRCLVESINLLFNLSSYDQLTRYHRLPTAVKENSSLKKAYEICIKLMNNNFYAVLKQSCHLNFLLFSVLSPSLPPLQATFLERLINASLTKRQVLRLSVSYLADVLFPYENGTASTYIVNKIFKDLRMSNGDEKEICVNTWSVVGKDDVLKSIPPQMKRADSRETWLNLMHPYISHLT